ncbi:MAG TPA: septum formation initiator family protein [Candidatus Saccharimonadales bacterium]|nr:septum formation initiator family protein [Candidatus Saccharimonadales bacterium]
MYRKIRSYLTLDTALPLLAVVIALSWAWSTVGVMQTNFQFQQQVDELRQQNALTDLENKTQEYRIAYYKTQEFAELAARANLNLAAPDEKVLVVPPSPYEQDSTSTLATIPPSAAPARSNFQQWLFFLFGKHPAQS